jgi:hypothetical protein
MGSPLHIDTLGWEFLPVQGTIRRALFTTYSAPQDSIGSHQYSNVPLTIISLFIVDAWNIFLMDLCKLGFSKIVLPHSSYSTFFVLYSRHRPESFAFPLATDSAPVSGFIRNK